MVAFARKEDLQNMPSTIRAVAFSAAVATLCALTATLAVLTVARPSILLAAPTASSTTSTFEPGVITSGDGLVSKKPDLALISVGVESKESTATAAQQDLAAKAGKLIARAKALGIADKDINTSGYFVGPNYVSSNTIDGYRAFEQLRLTWHGVDTVGKALDALVQEGGGTQISVGFTLADPKVAQAEARSLAIGDARSRAQAMAGAAGVKLGKVLRVSDLSVTGYRSAIYDVGASAAPVSTQVPVGQLDVQVSVEVDFAIDG
jgi:uncharacterized protein YggE